MLDKETAQRHLMELKKQYEILNATEWLYIKNREGELIHLTLNAGVIRKEIIEKLKAGINCLENFLVTAK